MWYCRHFSAPETIAALPLCTKGKEHRVGRDRERRGGEGSPPGRPRTPPGAGGLRGQASIPAACVCDMHARRPATAPGGPAARRAPRRPTPQMGERSSGRAMRAPEAQSWPPASAASRRGRAPAVRLLAGRHFPCVAVPGGTRPRRPKKRGRPSKRPGAGPRRRGRCTDRLARARDGGFTRCRRFCASSGTPGASVHYYA